MIIDRIFSLVNKRRLSTTMSERVANADRIKNSSYVFERLEDGSYNVTIMEGPFSIMYILTLKVALQNVNGSYQLVSKLKLLPILYCDFFLVGFAWLAMFERPILVVPTLLFITAVFILAFVVTRHFAFNDVEHALRQAEYIKD